MICIYLLHMYKMDLNETVYIKYVDGQAIITENLSDADIKIAYSSGGLISAYIVPRNDLVVPSLLTLAIFTDMEGYTGENKNTFDKFVNHMIHKINIGKYIEKIINPITYHGLYH